ncbi:histidine phosphatase family protein [Planococcus sp. APC 3906]|uniref:histidine phosphatase family protein n=1 Tax=Planococcus sp. APC 3906 TaxID=3035194 RepID=UPI0025B51DDD|nr:histidine phosphatase family protein [Planococcus sp. APC 3906]MDN3450586.1 histidine phosphatase family protein [Planococcus sp. APC 3906]
MTVIGIVRHGITEWNLSGIAQGSSDVPLNETGKSQAAALADRLSAEERWDMIISSDLARAKETAEIISEKLALPISFFDTRLREMSGGEIEGTTEQQRLEKWGAEWRKLDLGMESSDSVGKRGREAIDSILKEFEGKRVLVVSHGALIGITLRRMLPERFEKTDLQNTSITILEHNGNEWDCTLYNCVKHLETAGVRD